MEQVFRRRHNNGRTSPAKWRHKVPIQMLLFGRETFVNGRIVIFCEDTSNFKNISGNPMPLSSFSMVAIILAHCRGIENLSNCTQFTCGNRLKTLEEGIDKCPRTSSISQWPIGLTVTSSSPMTILTKLRRKEMRRRYGQRMRQVWTEEFDILNETSQPA